MGTKISRIVIQGALSGEFFWCFMRVPSVEQAMFLNLGAVGKLGII